MKRVTRLENNHLRSTFNKSVKHHEDFQKFHEKKNVKAYTCDGLKLFEKFTYPAWIFSTNFPCHVFWKKCLMNKISETNCGRQKLKNRNS